MRKEIYQSPVAACCTVELVEILLASGGAEAPIAGGLDTRATLTGGSRDWLLEW